MKPFLIVLGFIFTSTFISCDQLKNLIGNKKAQNTTEDSAAAQKNLEAIAAQVVQKLAEQQKKEADEKAKHDQEIEAEVQKRLTQMQAAPQTQPAAPQTQPMPQAEQKPAEKPVEKIVERVIVREKAPSAAPAPEQKPARPSGYVKLFEHKGNFGSSLTLRLGQNASDTDHTTNDQGFTNFKDNCSSATLDIPSGWRVLLFEHTNYRGRSYVLQGSGQVGDLGYMNDKCSSIRWDRTN